MNTELVTATGPGGHPVYRFHGKPFEVLVLLDLYDPDWMEWSDDPGSILHDGPNGMMYVDLDVVTWGEETRGDTIATMMRSWYKALEDTA